MFKVIERESVVPNIHLLKIEAPQIARKIELGQFIVVMSDEKGERIPLSVADWSSDEGYVTTVFMEVGKSTHKLTLLKPGDSIPVVVGPLGQPTHIEKFGTVVCAGGCYGIADIFPLTRALKKKENRVISMIEARSKFLIYWEEKIKDTSDRLVVVTRDGLYGKRGHVPEGVEEMLESEEQIDRVFAFGCTFMMMLTAETTRPFGVKTIVSLNPIMVDGTGMCGACRVSVAGETKFACVDGPEFDGHEVDWGLLRARRQAYMSQETSSAEL